MRSSCAWLRPCRTPTATSPTCSTRPRRSRSGSNGLWLLAASDPDLMAADFAIPMEPSNAGVEAGCQGTLRWRCAPPASARTRPELARVNAIHGAAEVLRRLAEYDARRPVIDGLEYREGLNAVSIRGGVAGNVLPDECVVGSTSGSPRTARRRRRRRSSGLLRRVRRHAHRLAPGALPGLDVPAARAFVEAVGAR